MRNRRADAVGEHTLRTAGYEVDSGRGQDCITSPRNLCTRRSAGKGRSTAKVGRPTDRSLEKRRRSVLGSAMQGAKRRTARRRRKGCSSQTRASRRPRPEPANLYFHVEYSSESRVAYFTS
jgi:hypothetical protein